MVCTRFAIRRKGPIGPVQREKVRLLLLFVKGLFSALGAVFGDLHLGGMGPLIAGGVVVFVAALGAFENRLITFFGSHGFTSFTA